MSKLAKDSLYTQSKEMLATDLFASFGSRQSHWLIILVSKIVCLDVLSLSHYLYLCFLLLSEMPRIFTMPKAKI